MVLAVDIGNTTIVIGVLADDEIKVSWRLVTDRHRLADEYGAQICELLRIHDIPRSGFEGIIISSVVPLALSEFRVMCERYFHLTPIVVSANSDIGIELRCDYPEEVGADRITTTVGAHQVYGGPLVIVDFGTATTFDAVSADGAYLGGVIAPGIGISMDALFDQTALLRRVDLSAPPNVIGKNTNECIRSGFYYGFLGQMEGIIRRMKAELGEAAKVIATGGLANRIAKDSELVDAIDAELMLKGLQIIYRRIQKKKEPIQ
ncbi:MAG: type III pantothenate kinase [Candidatus Poribacteria bacterium]|nr:type III pantothenate kinase [Candidatus Poribacteria bacterium]